MLIAKSSEKVFIMEQGVWLPLYVAVLAWSLQQKHEYGEYCIYFADECGIPALDENDEYTKAAHVVVNADDIYVVGVVGGDDEVLSDAIYEMLHPQVIALKPGDVAVYH